MIQADGSGGIPNMDNAGSEKQKKITKIVLCYCCFCFNIDDCWFNPFRGLNHLSRLNLRLLYLKYERI